MAPRTTKKPAGGRTTPKGTKPDLKATSVKEWKSNSRTPVPLELPSGNVCIAINRGMRAFLAEGKIPNSLVPLVQKALESAEGGVKAKEIADVAEDPQMLVDVITLVDNVVLSCVLDPPIEPAPKQNERGMDIDENGEFFVRDPDLLYVDQLDMNDKMFVFNWSVGGTKDLESFRREQASYVADLQGGEGVGSKAE